MQRPFGDSRSKQAETVKNFLAELRRRQVYKVGAIYLVVAWLVTQVAVSIEEPLGLPGWLDTLVIILLAVSFPIALVLAWAFETKPRDSATAADAKLIAEPASPPPKAIRPNVRFCTTPDGYRLAYARVGSGFPLVRTGNWISHQEFEWDSPAARHMLRDLSSSFELITYDGRGTGLSDRSVTSFSLDTMVEDMEVVVDANHLERFAVLAFSQSCAVSIAYAVKHPGRVTHMVLLGGFVHNFRPQEEVDAIASLFAQSWGRANPATRQIFTAALVPDATKEEFDEFNELQKHSISPENASRLFRAVHAIDVRELAKQVSVPTLVMHARDEPGVPLEYGREIASLIPDARFVILDSKNHILLEREPAYQRFLDETKSFIGHG